MSKRFIYYGSTTTAAPFLNTKSLLLDGTDDYLSISNSTPFQITGAMTFSTWVKTNDTSFSGLLFKGNSISLSDYYFRMQSNGTMRFFMNNLAKNVTSSTPINDGAWHNIIFVFIPSVSMTIYIDGVLDAQNTSSIPPTLNNNYTTTRIGFEAASQYWGGNIDETALWNTDQSANVSTIYNSGTPYDLTALSPTVWYRNGDGDTYPTIKDQVGSSDAIMTNMTAGDIVNDTP